MNSTELLIASWKQVAGRLEKALAAFSDHDLQREVAPGRNRIHYLIGHLAAVNDRMIPMLFLGDRLHPELDEAFITNPDRALPDAVASSHLRQALVDVNQKLTDGFEKLPPGDWLKRHSAVSEEEFAKEPLRNRQAVLLSRTNHMSFHLGQIILVK